MQNPPSETCEQCTSKNLSYKFCFGQAAILDFAPRRSPLRGLTPAFFKKLIQFFATIHRLRLPKTKFIGKIFLQDPLQRVLQLNPPSVFWQEKHKRQCGRGKLEVEVYPCRIGCRHR